MSTLRCDYIDMNCKTQMTFTRDKKYSAFDITGGYLIYDNNWNHKFINKDTMTFPLAAENIASDAKAYFTAI